MDNTDNFAVSYESLNNGDHCQDFVESLQCAFVRAGGVFQSRDILMAKTIADLNDILTKSNIATIFIEEKEEN